MEKCENEEKVIEYAKKLKVIGHPLRMQILILIEGKSSCVGDLWQCLNTSQPSISQHLAILKDAEIVSSHSNLLTIVDENELISTTSDTILIIASK